MISSMGGGFVSGWHVLVRRSLRRLARSGRSVRSGIGSCATLPDQGIKGLSDAGAGLVSTAAPAAAEQSLPPFPQLRIGRTGIVQNTRHIRIDARLAPHPLHDDRNAEADRVGATPWPSVVMTSFGSTRKASIFARDRQCRRRSSAPAGRPETGRSWWPVLSRWSRLR